MNCRGMDAAADRSCPERWADRDNEMLCGPHPRECSRRMPALLPMLAVHLFVFTACDHGATSTDVMPSTVGTRTTASCPCPAGQVCVVPTCCVSCRATDGGCQPGESENGPCSQGLAWCGYPFPCPQHWCSAPCQSDPPYCIVAPGGCNSLPNDVVHSQCLGNGQYGGMCDEWGRIACTQCY